jgi:cyclohexa-1,5-dienecarbonyl-CoA hydratase
MPEKIHTEFSHDGQVLNLTLAAPKGNVLDSVMIRELTEAVKDDGRARDVKLIVFRGEGKHFSFGASVEEHQKELVGEMLPTFHRLFRTLIEVSKPTCAVVRGQCLGGGMELAAFCHWIFASEDAAFGQPEIVLAVFPPVASILLPHRIGQAAADDLILTGRSVAAKEALELGLVNSVSEDPEAEFEAFLRQHILPKSAVALGHAVSAARFELHRALLRHLDELEKFYLEQLMQTEDANEGIRSFLEKRKPVWKNC